MSRYPLIPVALLLCLPALSQQTAAPAPTEGALIGRLGDGMSGLMSRFQYEMAACDKSGQVRIELALKQLEVDSMAATTDLEASVATAELRLVLNAAQGAQARSLFAQSAYQACSQWTSDMQRAWSNYYSGVARATQVATDDGMIMSRASQRAQELFQRLQQSLQSGDLASLAPSLQPSLPSYYGTAGEIAAAVAAADAAVAKAEKTFDAELALQRETAQGVIGSAMKELAQDPDRFRAACDDAIKVLKLKTQDAYETLEAACRAALLNLALGGVGTDDVAGVEPR